MVQSMKGNGNVVINMDLVRICFLMDPNMKVSIIITSLMGKANKPGLMVKITRVTSYSARKMALVNCE